MRPGSGSRAARRWSSWSPIPTRRGPLPAVPGSSTSRSSLPDRVELARALRRLTEAGGMLTGASDHLVSESLYLNDPEGNGIEIYRDRPRNEWQFVDGALQMASLPLDLDALMAEAPDQVTPMPEGTKMGHVHLQVAELVDVRRFYEQLIGLEVTVDTYPGALFAASGGYHHHIGLNVWQSEGGSPPPPGSRGLRWFELTGPGTEVEAIAKRLDQASLTAELTDHGLIATDPSGNAILLKADS